MKRLQRIPIPVAIIIMVFLIVAGVAFGNHNALTRAAAEPEAILAEVSATASQRASKAKNLLVVANRNEVEAKNRTALEDAIAGLEDARRAGQLASANQSLTFAASAINEQLQLVADTQDKKLATGVMDDLGSLDKQLIRQANNYNDLVEDVRSLYKRLPLGWVLGGMPEVYQ